METFIIVPRQRSADALRAAAAEDSEALTQATLHDIRVLLAGTIVKDVPILTESGLIAANGTVLDRGGEASRVARDQRAPRLLSELGIVLIDDPASAVLAKLRDEADVLPNIEISIIEPLDQQEVPSCSPWHLAAVNVAAARAKGLDGAGVRIGILDTGISVGHSAFAGKRMDFAEFDASGFPISTSPRDSGDHGTHVCALAAGNTCGIAPRADLSVAAVLTTKTAKGNSGRLAQILAGLSWVAHSDFPSAGGPVSRCPVLSASLGSSGYNPYLVSSLQIIGQAPAALLIAAIGNDGRRGVNYHGSPGNYDIVLGVGATDRADLPAIFTDWGLVTQNGPRKPDLSAPGVDICSALPWGRFGLKSGTSMATPQIAGAAALLVQQTPSLARNPVGLFTALLALTDATPAAKPGAVVSGYNRIGQGRLDLTYI